MDFVIRRIRAHEGRALRTLRLRALADAPSAFASTYAAEAAQEDEAWEELARKRATGNAEATFVAESRGEPIGIAGGFVDRDGQCVHLVSMWTAPPARRAGVATALVEAVTEWARQCGAKEVELWVAYRNEPARDLYASLAFTPTGEYQPLPSDPSQPEQRMRLSLDDWPATQI